MSKANTYMKHPMRTGLAVICSLALICGLSVTALGSQVSIADDTGQIELEVTSSLPQLSNENTAYSLLDGQYTVYKDHQCTQKAALMTTDASGHALSGYLTAGRYFIRQTQASPGYAMSDKLFQADVSVGKTTLVTATETPHYAAPTQLISLVNAETEKANAVAGSSLEGARLIVSYYENDRKATLLAGPTRQWTFVSDDAGKVVLDPSYTIEGSSLYRGMQNTPCLPLGHYTVFMERASNGYADSTGTQSLDVIDASRTDIDPICPFEPIIMKAQVIRGDIMFKKVDENQRPMAGVPFLLSYANGEDKSLIERHVLITDANGDCSTDAARLPHSTNTNKNDKALTPLPNGNYDLKEGELEANAGTWFSLDADGNVSLPDDSLGALPYGAYTLQELPCTANAGMNLSTVSFTIYKNDFTTGLGTLMSTVPSISDVAMDAADNDKLIKPRADACIVDTVSYRNLVPGKAYRLTTTAITTDTGEFLPGNNGEAAYNVTTFTPNEKDGRLQVQLAVDTSKFAGHKVSIMNDLSADDGSAIKVDNTDENAPIIEIEPIFNAQAYDTVDKDKYIMGSEAAITERIAYEGLDTGTVYVIRVLLSDKATGNTLRNAQGQVIEAHATLCPDAPAGTIELELPVDVTGIEGHDIVVFNFVSTEDGTRIASLQDIEDGDQTVKTVKLTTNAVDKSDGDKLFDAYATDVTIVDTVKYANLNAGEEYEIRGALMDKETGSAVCIDDVPITANAFFVPSEISGSIDVAFTFDASAQASDVLVVFETLLQNGNIIAAHTDLDDVAQTVTSEVHEGVKDLAINNQGSSSSSGKSPKTGDAWTPAIGAALIAIICGCAITSLVLRKRRQGLEAIARTSDLDE